MILAVVMNGGLLYMVYPALVFGIAMCEEERPGKIYWYFVLFYTQLIIGNLIFGSACCFPLKVNSTLLILQQSKILWNGKLILI